MFYSESINYYSWRLKYCILINDQHVADSMGLSIAQRKCNRLKTHLLDISRKAGCFNEAKKMYISFPTIMITKIKKNNDLHIAFVLDFPIGWFWQESLAFLYSTFFFTFLYWWLPETTVHCFVVNHSAFHVCRMTLIPNPIFHNIIPARVRQRHI